MLLLGEFLAVDFVFRCINAALVFVLIAYFFKKYGLLRIQAMRNEQETQHHQWIAKKQLLEERLHIVVDEQRDQEMTYRSLQERIIDWQKAVADAQEQHIAKDRALQEKMVAKRQKQAEFIELQKVRHVVMPHALDEARKELEHIFVHEGERYIKTAILRMKDVV